MSVTQEYIDLNLSLFADARNRVNRLLSKKVIYGQRIPQKFVVQTKILDAVLVELNDYVIVNNDDHDYIYELIEFAKRKCLLTFHRTPNIDDFRFFDEDDIIIITISEYDVEFKKTEYYTISTNLSGNDQYDSMNARHTVQQSIDVELNGLSLEVGNSDKTKDCYFSSDLGVTAKALNQIVVGDRLYLNATNIGYTLQQGWIITITII